MKTIVYECVLIFDVQMVDAGRESILKEVADLVAGGGGSVVETVPYGIRPLTIELKGRTRGDYRVVRFTAPGDTLQRLDRMLRLKDEVLRFLVTKYYPPKPKKERKKKPKKDESGQTETEGETASHGKSEQSIPDRQSNPTA